MSQLIQDNHRFLDEAGDTTFYGKGKVPIIGQEKPMRRFVVLHYRYGQIQRAIAVFASPYH